VRQRFAMTERDEATGLDHTWFRKYDSFAGRWTTPDPLGGSIADPQSFNRYTYAANDPINLVDPVGLDPSDHEPGHSEPDGPCPPGSPCSVDIYPGPSPVLGGTAGPEVFIPREPPSEGPGVDPPTGGDPQKPSKKETFLEALKRCVYEKFGVTLEGFTSATSKRDGVFKGTGYNRYSQRNERLKIITNVWYGSSLRLATLNNDYRRNNPDKGQPLVGPGQRVLGVTLSYGLGLSMYQSPFLNYLANDLPKEYNTDEWRRRQQVHELGHSLADITGNFKKGDEAGEILESCVFGSTANQR
jgi:RHS repeat-associated protein